MPKKPQKSKRRKLSNNPLNNLNLSIYTQPKEETKGRKKDSYEDIQKEYERLLHKEIRRENRAYRVIYKNHPDLLFIAFCGSRGQAKYESARYFRSTFNPFFTGENYRQEMLDSKSYRCQELDQFALKGIVPIPDLLRILDISMPCSVCGKDHFDYSDYDIGRCFIVEGEGNLNPFTQGYILCYECHKKYVENNNSPHI